MEYHACTARGGGDLPVPCGVSSNNLDSRQSYTHGFLFYAIARPLKNCQFPWFILVSTGRFNHVSIGSPQQLPWSDNGYHMAQLACGEQPTLLNLGGTPGLYWGGGAGIPAPLGTPWHSMYRRAYKQIQTHT